ncbi:MAG: heavy metal translocating P-type ATPase [Pirellulales bacterium]|nr:heavy metal translocating P-type ATPase [Pirellulales bacterium]
MRAMQQAEFKIRGMDCAEEVSMLRSELTPIAGVEDLKFDILSGKMTVVYSESAVSPETFRAAVAKTGMQAEPWKESDVSKSTGWALWGRTVMTTVSGFLLLLGLAIHLAAGGWQAIFGSDEGLATPWAARVCYFGAAVCGAWYVAPKGWRALLRLRPDMNLLMIVAITGAFPIDEFLEAATVAFLFAVSLALESWSVGRARRAIAALMSISPNTARVVQSDGKEAVVDVKDILVGTIIVARPGERFPLDGKIVKGETKVNQAPITGESAPVAKVAGDDVFAGTINGDGAVELVTTKPAEDTTLSRIIRMVGDAQSKRSPSEQWVEQFARYYTPAVMLLALAVIVLPPLMTGGSWSRWFYEGLVLLVIACPCALVISTPVTIVAALAASARRGVLVKGGLYMEVPGKLKAIAMDKTGTLTEGHPEVREVVPLSGHTEAEVLAIAAAVEARSEHPLARAILRASADQGVHPVAAEGFQAIKGKGATASINGKLIWLGSHRMLEERGQETPQMHERLTRMEADGSSVVVIGKDEHVCGFIALADRIRPDAKKAIEQIRAAGIQHIVMLTGDNRGTANAIARESGVDDVRAELLPEDKLVAIEELVRQFGQIAMVGDGVNDAPAMARATLGIAMGAAGTDAALETADIALMGDDLMGVPWLIDHSRRCMRVIGQNIALSLGVKVAFVVLTLMGSASLWAAIAADTGASLVVVFNGLRMLNAGKVGEDVSGKEAAVAS